MQHRVMLDGGSNQMASLGLRRPSGPENGQVVGFGSAAGEDDFTWLGAENFRRAIAGVIKQCPRFLTDMMNGGRISQKSPRNGSIASRTAESSGVVAL